MPVKDVEALYLLVGEVKGKLENVQELQAEFRRSNSAINVTIAAQSGATAALTADIKSLSASVAGLDSKVSALDVKVSSLMSTRDRSSGFVTGIKFAWAALIAIGSMASGFVGWIIGQHQKPW